jgi:methyltransferase
LQGVAADESLHPAYIYACSQINNYFISSIRQSRTARWIVGWSFTDHRLPDVRTSSSLSPSYLAELCNYQSLTRVSSPATVKYLPLRNSFQLNPSTNSLSLLKQHLTEVLTDIGLLHGQVSGTEDWHKHPDLDQYTLLLRPTVQSWSRSARRKAGRTSAGTDSSAGTEPLFTGRLEICLHVQDRSTEKGREASPTRGSRSEQLAQTHMSFHWDQGRSRLSVETFWAYIVRKMQERLVGSSTRTSPCSDRNITRM